jgi:hypothetical protein
MNIMSIMMRKAKAKKFLLINDELRYMWSYLIKSKEAQFMERINDVPILLRREIEALMVAPFLDAFAKEFGWEKTLEIAQGVIAELARKAGKELAAAAGGNTLEHLARVIPAFSQGGALETEVVESTSECIRMNVTRCEYTEMYAKHHLNELGLLLSCQRDGYLFEGFNPDIEFTRTGTKMDGQPCCDFCLKLRKCEKNEN